MEASSYFLWAPVDAGVVSFWVPRISQIDLRSEGRLQQITDALLRNLDLCFHNYGLLSLDLGKVIYVWLFKVLFSAIEAERYFRHIELASYRKHPDLSWSRQPSHAQDGIISKGEQDLSYLARREITKALELCQLQRIINPDLLRREGYCRWNKAINGGCEELQLRIAERFEGLGPDMNHRWILNLELMLEWNGDLLLRRYDARYLHVPNPLKVFCIDKRDEQILMIR